MSQTVKQVKTDAVVLGSGLGGVLCAALLSREGYKVTLLERMGFPGGRYTTVDKDGFKINTGAWAIGLHGARGPVYRLIHDLGCRVEAKVPEPDHAHLWYENRDITLPAKGQLRFIIDTVAKNKKESDRVMEATRHALKWQEPSDDVTCSQWLYQYTDNPLIHAHFDFFSRGMTATYSYDYPAGAYFRLMRKFGMLGDLTIMAKDGQKTTMDEIIRILKEGKVDIRYNTEVTKIISNNKNRVTGVLAKTEGNDEIEIAANIVVSDIGPKATVKLADEANFSTSYLNQVYSLNETKAMVIVFGYGKPLLKYQSHIQFLGYDRLGTAWEPVHMWPGYAPKGKNCLYTYSTMKSSNTAKEKELILEQCKQAFPGLDKAEIISTIAFKAEWPILRSMPTRCLSIKSPIRGLYIAGDAVNPDGWTCGEGIAISCPSIVKDIIANFPLDK